MDLSTLTHHMNGGSVSDYSFALTALLRVWFAPRIPNIADRKLYEARLGTIGLMDPVDWTVAS